MFNPNILVELQKEISTIRKEVTQSIVIAKECSEKVDKQNDATMLNRLCNIRSYLTMAVLIIAILIALLLQLPHGISEDQMVEHLSILQVNISKYFTIKLNNISVSVSKLQVAQHNTLLWNKQFQENISRKLNETKEQLNSLQVKIEDNIRNHTQNITKLQQQIIITQVVLNETVTSQQKYFYQLGNSIWSIKLVLSSDDISNQVAPVVMKMSSFTEKLMNKEEWWSNPFFAFGGGYQISLSVSTASNGKGEGTHASVYLHLMKGPHDDKLEQSGHWPLRGTFTIELLNQLNDSDHYSRMLQFHHHRCSECSDRVVSGTKSRGWAFHSSYRMILSFIAVTMATTEVIFSSLESLMRMQSHHIK